MPILGQQHSNHSWNPNIVGDDGRTYGTMATPTAEERQAAELDAARWRAAQGSPAMDAAEVFALVGVSGDGDRQTAIDEMQQRGFFFLGFPQPLPTRMIRKPVSLVAEAGSALLGVPSRDEWTVGPLQWERRAVTFWLERFLPLAEHVLRQHGNTKKK